MCLIIHKPVGVPIAGDLIEAATALNPDGWGAMGLKRDGEPIIHRELTVDAHEVNRFAHAHLDSELVLHLRRRTRGTVSTHNTHPFEIFDGLYLMHNGTLNLKGHTPGWSDTRHLVNDLLRPLGRRYEGLLGDAGFLQVLGLCLRPENKLALLDVARRRIAIINREDGAEFEGLWLSNTRWIDRRQLPLGHTPQAQERAYRLQDLGLLA